MNSTFSQHAKRSKAGRRALALLLAAVAGIGLSITGATAAQAGVFTAHVISGRGVQFVNVRANTNTTSTILRTIKFGAAVGLNCYQSGGAVKGPYGTSTIWYSIDGGGWVTDAYLETGSNNPVTPKCGVAQTTTFALPFPAGSRYKVTTTPGTASHADKYNRNAVDFGNGTSGGSVVASAAGKVYSEGWSGAGGIIVLIDHGNNRCTQYAHLSRSVVDKGNSVAKGQKIGAVGGSGYGRQGYYAAHLHWNMVYCDTRLSRETINTVEQGTSYPLGAWVTSRNS
ncbi:peptidoglycan DD-metalloendopeptidase family protein [Cryobacterium sp. SO2]|uniref:peptidoglycan DD-metalloendopeptidase family protein n=1 Tax=Cryobacterium sp. SO2 TaxID=1897060 RepID=UPI00223CAA48|nr:peptidoglycan DD-metalloendopeptidase family protein [Cryobacterium sp. SO2]WEO77493.1 peptidoglycan DD-metalloendopeptidase family protein [Cryobacterium sp. SO2]